MENEKRKAYKQEATEYPEAIKITTPLFSCFLYYHFFFFHLFLYPPPLLIVFTLKDNGEISQLDSPSISDDVTESHVSSLDKGVVSDIQEGGPESDVIKNGGGSGGGDIQKEGGTEDRKQDTAYRMLKDLKKPLQVCIKRLEGMTMEDEACSKVLVECKKTVEGKLFRVVKLCSIKLLGNTDSEIKICNVFCQKLVGDLLQFLNDLIDATNFTTRSNAIIDIMKTYLNAVPNFEFPSDFLHLDVPDAAEKMENIDDVVKETMLLNSDKPMHLHDLKLIKAIFTRDEKTEEAGEEPRRNTLLRVLSFFCTHDESMSLKLQGIVIEKLAPYEQVVEYVITRVIFLKNNASTPLRVLLNCEESSNWCDLFIKNVQDSFDLLKGELEEVRDQKLRSIKGENKDNINLKSFKEDLKKKIDLYFPFPHPLPGNVQRPINQLKISGFTKYIMSVNQNITVSLVRNNLTNELAAAYLPMLLNSVGDIFEDNKQVCLDDLSLLVGVLTGVRRKCLPHIFPWMDLRMLRNALQHSQCLLPKGASKMFPDSVRHQTARNSQYFKELVYGNDDFVAYNEPNPSDVNWLVVLSNAIIKKFTMLFWQMSVGCSFCGEVRELSACSRCLSPSFLVRALYCSDKCEYDNWQNHKNDCKPMDLCSNQNCTKKGVKVCTRCKKVKYCGKECQKEHWLSIHKKKCY
mmetsp:Transcript_36633/g.47307  ORF Transcript_36633/g.47307 Transcript_36633/m.47307 type:complete len:687 (+) Transcript_36633:22-2082(+)